MIDLNDLALFLQVVRAGSFAEAARRLAVPSNTLSRRVSDLEAAMETRLLQRSTRKMTLTEQGRLLFERSSAHLDETLEVVREMRSHGPEPSGTVRAAVTADFFEFVPIEWVAGFLAANPKIRAEFVLSDDFTDVIADGIDIAFRSGELKDSSLIARKLQALPLVLAASPAYLRKRGMPQSLEDLGAHDCITAGKRGRTVWRVNGASGPELVTVRGRFGSNTAKSQVRAAHAGLGICLAPEKLVMPYLRDGSLIAVLPEMKGVAVDLHVVLPNRKHVPQAVSVFLEAVLAELV